MGLAIEILQFSEHVPELVEVEQHLRRLTDRPVTITGSLAPTPEDKKRSELYVETTTFTPIRRNHLTCRIVLKHRTDAESRRFILVRRLLPFAARILEVHRTGRYIEVSISLDGKKLFLIGNDNHLMKLLSEAFQRLGGKVEQKRPIASK